MRMPESGLADLARRDWRIFADPLDGARRQFADCGPVVMEKWGPLRLVNLFGPDANELVLMNRDENFVSRPAWNFFIGDIFPNGLMLRDGEDHRRHRRVMRAGFHRTAIAGYLAAMNPLIDERLASLPAELHAHELMKLLTLELAWNVFVGESRGDEHARLNHAFETAVAASLAVVRIPVPPLLLWRGVRARTYLREHLRSLLPRKRSGAQDMFGILARAEGEDGERFSDDDVLDHMVFMMMAAHDTTTSTLSSMIYELGRHPEWQERLRDEALSIDAATPTVESLDRMVLADAVMRETLRRYPPLPVIPRGNVAAFEFRGYRIPAKSLVVTHPILTHHMPEYWDEPMRFDPDRFLAPREEHRRHRFQFVPFSGGVHLCLGMQFAEVQIKALLASLLKRYRWSLRPGYEMPFVRIPISRPRDGLPIRLRRIAAPTRAA